MSHASADGAVLESQRKQGPTPPPFFVQVFIVQEFDIDLAPVVILGEFENR